MNYRRELELKFVVDEGRSLEQVERDVCALLRDHDPIRDTSPDRFWSASGIDFARLRDNTREFTIKVSDRGNTKNRIEENIIVHDIDTTRRWATLAFGEERSFVKTFSVWRTKLPGANGPGVVCLYRVETDPERRVFLEVEANDVETVDAMAVFMGRYFRLTPESRSLFQIFFPEVL